MTNLDKLRETVASLRVDHSLLSALETYHYPDWYELIKAKELVAEAIEQLNHCVACLESE